MRVIAVSKSTSSVELTADNVLLLSNALNEALHGIDIPAFQTRLGVTTQRAEDLFHELGMLLDKMKE
jgi:hypothetical protein